MNTLNLRGLRIMTIVRSGCVRNRTDQAKSELSHQRERGALYIHFRIQSGYGQLNIHIRRVRRCGVCRRQDAILRLSRREHKRRDVRSFSHTTLCLIGRGRRCRCAMGMTRAQPPERSRTPAVHELSPAVWVHVVCRMCTYVCRVIHIIQEVEMFQPEARPPKDPCPGAVPWPFPGDR
jgi:hypothetical protein